MSAADASSPSVEAAPDVARSRVLYRQRAAGYDAELAPFEPLRRQAVDLLDLQPGQQVLDLGCGTGLSLPLLAEKVGPTGRVWGLEPCPEMARRARQRCTQAGWPQVQVCQGEATQPDGWPQDLRADAALFQFSHDILQQPEALAAVMAHLRPGATVVSCGLEWAPAWAWAANAWVLSAALYSVTSLREMHQPWHLLANWLPDLQVHSTWMGCIYFAVGHVPDAPVSPV